MREGHASILRHLRCGVQWNLRLHHDRQHRFIFRGSNIALEETEVCGNESDQIDDSWTDNGGNSVTEQCPTDCPADIGGVVDAADLASILGCWGSDDPMADINGDDEVNRTDQSHILRYWGVCSAP